MLGNGSNYIEQPTKSHDKVTTLKNAIGCVFHAMADTIPC